MLFDFLFQFADIPNGGFYLIRVIVNAVTDHVFLAGDQLQVADVDVERVSVFEDHDVAFGYPAVVLLPNQPVFGYILTEPHPHFDITILTDPLVPVVLSVGRFVAFLEHCLAAAGVHIRRHLLAFVGRDISFLDPALRLPLLYDLTGDL
jgi:hypothetical protein